MNTQNNNDNTNKFTQILLRDFMQSNFEIQSYELLIDYVLQIHEHVMNNDVFVNATIENDMRNDDVNCIYIDFRLNCDDELNTILRFNVDDDNIKFILNHKCVCNNIFEYDNDDDVDKLIIDQKMIIDRQQQQTKSMLHKYKKIIIDEGDFKNLKKLNDASCEIKKQLSIHQKILIDAIGYKFNDQQLLKMKNNEKIKSYISNAIYDNIDFDQLSYDIDDIFNDA